MQLNVGRFELALEDVLLHQVVEQNLSAAPYGVLARHRPEGAQSFVRRFVDQFAECPAAVALELAREGDDHRYLHVMYATIETESV